MRTGQHLKGTSELGLIMKPMKTDSFKMDVCVDGDFLGICGKEPRDDPDDVKSRAGHVITGDVNIVENEDLRSLISKRPKFREPRSFNWRQNFISIMNSVEDYARRWVKYEKEELDTLSEWIKSIRRILKSRIRHIRRKVRTIYPSVFRKPEVINELDRLHEEYVLVPADKACNNIVFVCKAHYYNCISKEHGINSTLGNRTYTPPALSKRRNSPKPCFSFTHI